MILQNLFLSPFEVYAGVLQYIFVFIQDNIVLEKMKPAQQSKIHIHDFIPLSQPTCAPH